MQCLHSTSERPRVSNPIRPPPHTHKRLFSACSAFLAPYGSTGWLFNFYATENEEQRCSCVLEATGTRPLTGTKLYGTCLGSSALAARASVKLHHPTVVAGQRFLYRVALANHAPKGTSLRGLFLVVAVPAEVEVVSAKGLGVPKSMAAPVVAGSNVTWDGIALKRKRKATLQLAVRVRPSAVPQTRLVFNATTCQTLMSAPGSTPYCRTALNRVALVTVAP